MRGSAANMILFSRGIPRLMSFAEAASFITGPICALMAVQLPVCKAEIFQNQRIFETDWRILPVSGQWE